MDAKRHEELRALCNAATPGPWHKKPAEWDYFWIMADDRDVMMPYNDPELAENGVGLNEYRANIDLCIAARAAMPELLDEVERLENVIRDGQDTVIMQLQSRVKELELALEPFAVEYNATLAEGYWPADRPRLVAVEHLCRAAKVLEGQK